MFPYDTTKSLRKIIYQCSNNMNCNAYEHKSEVQKTTLTKSLELPEKKDFVNLELFPNVKLVVHHLP